MGWAIFLVACLVSVGGIDMRFVARSGLQLREPYGFTRQQVVVTHRDDAHGICVPQVEVTTLYTQPGADIMRWSA